MKKRNKKKCISLTMLMLSLALFGCGRKQMSLISYEAVTKESTASQDAGTAISEPVQNSIYVYLCGAVKKPGVYQVTKDTRIYEVVNMAGGLLPEADESSINYSQKVNDGMQIIIPTVQEEVQPKTQGKNTKKETAVKPISTLVNINTADIERLCSLPGIGEAKAKTIIEYRETNGSFQSIEDIMNVPGIKEGMFAKIKDLIEV